MGSSLLLIFQRSHQESCGTTALQKIEIRLYDQACVAIEAELQTYIALCNIYISHAVLTNT